MRAFVAVEIDNKDVLQKIESVQISLQFKAKPVRIDQVHLRYNLLEKLAMKRLLK